MKREFQTWDELLNNYIKRWGTPSLACNRVEYFYKPETKYPARIYLFLEASVWEPRNRRPMGLQNSLPILDRVGMYDHEKKTCLTSNRQTYFQFESWQDLMLYEKDEGASREWLNRLENLKKNYPLSDGYVQSSCL